MQPYEGLKVIEVVGRSSSPAIGLAIAMCGRILADLGAQVSVVNSDSTVWSSVFLSRGKIPLSVEGSEDFPAGLVEVADVALVDRAMWPLPVRCRAVATVAMDHDNEDERREQSEFTIEARSGLLDIVGDPHRAPLRLGGHQTAFAAGLSAFTGIAASLTCEKEAVVHVSLLEVATWLNWKAIATACHTGQVPSRRGDLAEWPVLACFDGHVAFVHREQEWERLLTAFPDAPLRQQRFSTAALREENRAALNAVLAEQVARLSRAELHALSLSHKLPLGPVWALNELRADRQMVARRMFAASGRPRLPLVWNGVRPGVAAAPVEGTV